MQQPQDHTKAIIMGALVVVTLGAILCAGSVFALVSGGDSDSPEEAAYRTNIKAILITSPGMNLFCQSIQGSPDEEVLALIDKVTGLSTPYGSRELRGAAIVKEECAHVFD
jgi:hypothetical protein